MDELYRKGVIAIIIDSSNKFLLIQLRGKGKSDWNFPGGGAEEGESFEDCLWRELNEECGLTKSDLKLLRKSNFNHKYEYNPVLLEEKRKQGSPYIGQEKAIFGLVLTCEKHKIHINEDEALDHKWIPFSKLKEYLLFPGQLETATNAIKELFPEVAL